MRLLRAVLALTLCLAAATASAEPARLRIATLAPDGSAWSREMRAMSREVFAQTNGNVEVRWYFDGIAGDEEQVVERIAKGQLEGIGAAIVCTRLAPSLRIFRVPGMFGNWSESLYVLSRLRPRIAAEFEAHGYVSLGEGGFGNDLVFSSTPVTSLAQLQKGRFGYWNIDDVMRESLVRAGMHAVPVRIAEARGQIERGELDGIITMPSPALAFQFSSVTHYWSELPLAFMPACLVIARGAFDALSIDDQRVVRAAGAKFQARINDLGREQDERLTGSLFEHQGLHKVVPSELFRSEFFAMAQRIRGDIDRNLVPPSLMELVLRWLADYRAENR
ncbi:MAG TPA: TRAP transporter substrate-binding protein DctP [Polyangia bacterium]|nr:TRAP transporter substrate-binding protein DctP [Polyangia bacterium]